MLHLALAHVDVSAILNAIGHFFHSMHSTGAISG